MKRYALLLALAVAVGCEGGADLAPVPETEDPATPPFACETPVDLPVPASQLGTCSPASRLADLSFDISSVVLCPDCDGEGDLWFTVVESVDKQALAGRWTIDGMRRIAVFDRDLVAVGLLQDAAGTVNNQVSVVRTDESWLVHSRDAPEGGSVRAVAWTLPGTAVAGETPASTFADDLCSSQLIETANGPLLLDCDHALWLETATLVSFESCPRDSTKSQGTLWANLDGDGLGEFLAAPGVYEANGDLRFCLSGDSGIPVPAQLDDDPELEVVLAAGGYAVAHDADGNVLWEFNYGVEPPTPSAQPVVPTAGDLDGDGRTEFIVAVGSWLSAFDDDGTLLWRAEVPDSSPSFSIPTLHDLSADGIPEVLFISTDFLAVLDAWTGSVLHLEQHGGLSARRPGPALIDWDGDCQAEVVIPARDGRVAILDPGTATKDGCGAAPWQGHTGAAHRVDAAVDSLGAVSVNATSFVAEPMREYLDAAVVAAVTCVDESGAHVYASVSGLAGSKVTVQPPS